MQGEQPKVHPEVIGLNGGKKQFWLRINRKMVENYYCAYGPEKTCEYFKMSLDTLQRFFDRKANDARLNKLSENDRYVLRMAMESTRALRSEVNRDLGEASKRIVALEEFQFEAMPVIQLVRSLAITTMGKIRGKVEPPALPDLPLELDDFVEKSEE